MSQPDIRDSHRGRRSIRTLAIEAREARRTLEELRMILDEQFEMVLQVLEDAAEEYARAVNEHRRNLQAADLRTVKKRAREFLASIGRG